MFETLIGFVGFLVGLFAGLAAWLNEKSRADAEAEQLRLQVASLEKDREADQEKLVWIETAKEQMSDSFTALATNALHANSESLTQSAKRDLEGVVNPLKEELKSLDGHVRELETSREGAYKSIEQQLSHITDTHRDLRKATVGLTEALRSPNVRGKWGEIQLRRVVEMAGMVNHVAFEEQASTDSGRPDMIVHLPMAGVLPLDSKVALDSYLNAIQSSADEERNRHLQDHAGAMRSRVKELGQKQYWDQFESAPDFVVMFVPNEACLGAAFESDPDLLEYAISKKVLISSPVTLLALLRAVAYGWQQQQITENALRIGREGQELYRRLEAFVDRFSELGESLSKSVERYNRAVGSFDKRLIPAARRFHELGVSTDEVAAPGEIDSAISLPIQRDESESTISPTKPR